MEVGAGRLTPFMLFYTEHRDAVKSHIMSSQKRSAPSNNAVPQQTKPEEISKEVFRLWCALDPERMQDYCKLSNLYAKSVAKHGGAGSPTAAGSASTRDRIGSNNSGGTREATTLITPSKRRTTTKKQGPRLPQPPVSSFMWFYQHHRRILRVEHRQLTFSEIGKAIAALWRGSTPAEKQPFDDLSAEDKARYARECNHYKAWLDHVRRSNGQVEGRLAAALPSPQALPSGDDVSQGVAPPPSTASRPTIAGAGAAPSATPATCIDARSAPFNNAPHASIVATLPLPTAMMDTAKPAHDFRNKTGLRESERLSPQSARLLPLPASAPMGGPDTSSTATMAMIADTMAPHKRQRREEVLVHSKSNSTVAGGDVGRVAVGAGVGFRGAAGVPIPAAPTAVYESLAGNSRGIGAPYFQQHMQAQPRPNNGGIGSDARNIVASQPASVQYSV